MKLNSFIIDQAILSWQLDFFEKSAPLFRHFMRKSKVSKGKGGGISSNVMLRISQNRLYN